MTHAIIVSKTRMHKGICVSGLTVSNQSIRLKPPGRSNQAMDTAFEIGQIWDLEFEQVQDLEPPHVEDVYITSQKYLGKARHLRSTLLQRVQPWVGDPANLFDRTITIEYNKAYIAKSGPLPSCSTGYWLSERPLVLQKDSGYNKSYYEVKHRSGLGFPLDIPFVGLVPPIEMIPPNTLVRVSLARWFQPSGAPEARCYLQISGWYE